MFSKSTPTVYLGLGSQCAWPDQKRVGVWRIPRLPHQVTKRPAEKGRSENAVKVKKSERREKRLSPFFLLSSPLCLAMCAIYRPAEPVRGNLGLVIRRRKGQRGRGIFDELRFQVLPLFFLPPLPGFFAHPWEKERARVGVGVGGHHF